MAPKIDLFKLRFPWNNYVVTKVGVKLMNNLKNIPRNVGYGGPQLFSSTSFWTPKALKLSILMVLLGINPRVMYFLNNCSDSKSKNQLE